MSEMCYTYPRMNRHLRCEFILRGCAVLFFVIPALSASSSMLHDEAVVYREQGYEAQQRGDRQTALAFYQKAMALDPAYAAPQNDLGTLLEDEGRLEEAERAYQRALVVQPTYAEAHSNLALLYERMGQQQEKAIYHWLKRYELGASDEAGTQRAKERLMAAGILHALPEVAPEPQSEAASVESASPMKDMHTSPTQSDIANQVLESHARSLDEFHAVTNQHSDWSR